LLDCTLDLSQSTRSSKIHFFEPREKIMPNIII